MGYLGLVTLFCIGIQLVNGELDTLPTEGDIWGRCPTRWHFFNDRCFLIPEEASTYHTAKRSCEDAGGHLASIDNADVQQFIANTVKTRNQRQVVQIHTGNDLPGNKTFTYVQDLGMDLTQHTSVVFSVKSGYGAHIILSEVKGVISNDSYHVTIGVHQNRASIIRKNYRGPVEDQVYHKGNFFPLRTDCNEPFWLSWSFGTLRVGYGNSVGKDQFLESGIERGTSINYVGVATGRGSTADWIFTTETFVPGKFFTGAWYNNSDKAWVWLPSETSLASYTNWGMGEPTNDYPGMHCVTLDMHDDMAWDEDYCSQPRNYVCEQAAITPPQDTIFEIIRIIMNKCTESIPSRMECLQQWWNS